MLTRPKKIRRVSGLDAHLQEIMDDLRERVNEWCSRNPTRPFAARDLVGHGHNWRGTPLWAVYTKHSGKPHEKRVKQAGRDVGWLLLRVVNDDQRRTFRPEHHYVMHYRPLPS